VKYRSATKRLIELRRGDEYRLVSKENAEYGFRRNLLGLRPAALAVLVGAAATTAWCRWSENPQLVYTIVAAALTGAGVVWFAMARRSIVEEAAFQYSDALLRTLEPGVPRKPQQKVPS
jgi:hypothetical protein